MRTLLNRILKTSAFRGYIGVIIISATSVILLRLAETIFIRFVITVPAGYFVSQFAGWYDDFVVIAFYLLLMLPVYILLSFIRQSVAELFACFVLTIFLITEALLTGYFSFSTVPLSYQNLAGTSAAQMDQVVAIYGFKMMHLLLLIPAVCLIFWTLWRFNKRLKRKTLTPWLVLYIPVTLIFSSLVELKNAHFESELNYQSARNKIGFFVESYFDYRYEQDQFEQTEIDEELEIFYELNEIPEPSYPGYPMLGSPELSNPLRSFFPEKDTTPNVVFVICESLGKQFSGEGARLGSFTPFLDSLAGQSLYWTNFMANAERTFGALPNLLAGVPEGENGFMNLRYAMPDHLSLPQLLKENNGYQTAFFCGAVSEFDHMDEFLMTQKFDFIRSKDDFTPNPVKTELLNAKGEKKYFNWGAEDAVVFKQSLEFMDSAFDSHKPYCNVYLTTSFHEPFGYSDMDVFRNKAAERIHRLNPPDKQNFLKEIETFAALMYMDQSLAGFFEQYRKRADFENTIFIICGDHSIKFMGNNTRLEKFHVPLLVYSPMLLESRQIKSISCQKDVPAALQALLRENFGLNLPEFSISQSDNLGISAQFTPSKANHVLMYADKTMNAYVWREYLYMDEAVYRIKDNLLLEHLNDEALQQNLQKRLMNYKQINRYICKKNKYLTDSLYRQFSKVNYLIKTRVGFEVNETGLTAVYGHDNLSETEFFSGSGSLTNNNNPYLSLVKDFQAKSVNRMRLKVSFTIHCPSANLPALLVYRKSGPPGEETPPVTSTFLLDNSKGILNETDKPGWYHYQCGLWFEKESLFPNEQKIGIYLFQKNEEQFFIDDLEIELREF